jgi:hypothetical protein
VSRPVAYVVGLGLAAAVAAPAFGHPPRDSFPLSTYPMFSTRRAMPVLEQAVAVSREGDTRPVPPELVASDEVMQASVTIRQAVWQGPASMAALCRSMAERAVETAGFEDVVRIEIVSARYDPILYFTEAREPVERVRRHACPVRRPGGAAP